MPVFDLGLTRDGGLTHVLDKGLGPRGWEDVLEVSGDHIDIVKLGWGTAYVTQNLRTQARRPARQARRHRRHVLRGLLRPRQAGRVQALAPGPRHRARRDLRRHRRHPARPQARADPGLREGLHRPLRGRLEGLGGRVRAVPVGRVDQGREGRGRVEGDHRGARGRDGRHLPQGRRHAHRPHRRDRARDRLPRPPLGGADEVVAGVVHQALRARASTSATSRRRKSSRSRRSVSGCAATR